MPAIVIEIFIILALILANGVFAMSEIALLSSRKVRLAQRAEDGEQSAKTALNLVESPNRFLSTIQVGITLIGILAGALGGATLAEPMAKWIAQAPYLAASSRELSVALVVILITYFSLVIGELVPKRLALSNPEGIAMSLAGLMSFISKLAYPVVQLLSLSTEGVLRLIRVKAPDEPPVTPEEIRVLMEQGTEVGVFEQAETNMVEEIFRLGDRLVGALLTPRTEIEWLDVDDSLDVNIRKVIASEHEYIPVAQSNLDNVLGILRAKDFLAELRGGDADLLALCRPALFIPESISALRLLDQLRTASGHLALVLDEFGGLLGMVTLYDVMEAIVGEFTSKDDQNQFMATRRDDGSWLIDGLMPIDRFKDLIDMDELPEEDRVGYQTVAGFLLSEIGAIPRVGDKFVYQNWEFEVVDMDGFRVDKVLATKDAPPLMDEKIIRPARKENQAKP